MHRFSTAPTKSSLISIGQAAKRLGVSIDTLRRWDKLGKLSSIRGGPRGHRFYNLENLEEFVQDQSVTAKRWAQSPQGADPDSEVYCKTRDVFQARLEKLQSKLSQEWPLGTVSLVKPDLRNAEEALKVAFTETVSGRLPEARGNGLKFVRKVVVENPFKLYFQTGDAYLDLNQHDKDVIVKRADGPLRGCFAKISF